MEFKNRIVNLKSILGVMGLGIPARSAITIHADGQDAQGMVDSGQ
nr:HPr family phosphocarrier protein [Planococcus maitriensis]